MAPARPRRWACRCSSPMRPIGRCCRGIASPRWLRAALGAPAELTVRIVGAEEGRALNREYRGKDYATNVLTFDYSARRRSWPTWCLRAGGGARGRRAGRRVEAHYAHLLVHGALHAQGFDHERDAEAKAMEARESEIVPRSASPTLRWLDRLERSAAPAAAPRRSRRASARSPRRPASAAARQPPGARDVPSTGINITDMVEAIGGRLRASTSQIACAKPKISERVVGDRAPGRGGRRGPAVALEQRRATAS